MNTAVVSQEQTPKYIEIDDSMHLRRVGVSPFDAEMLWTAATHEQNIHLSQFEAWPHYAKTPTDAAGMIAAKKADVIKGTAMPYNIIAGRPENDANQDGQLLGSVQLHGVYVNIAAMSYWLDHRALGRGIAYQSSLALVRQGFMQGINHIRFNINPKNTRSINLAERLGAEKYVGKVILLHNTPHHQWFLTQPAFAEATA